MTINYSCFTRSKPEYLQGMKPGTRMWVVYFRVRDATTLTNKFTRGHCFLWISWDHSATLARSLLFSLGDESKIKINIPFCHWNCQDYDNNSCPFIFLFFLDIQNGSFHWILLIFLQTQCSTVSAVKSYCIVSCIASFNVFSFPMSNVQLHMHIRLYGGIQSAAHFIRLRQ